MKKFEKNHGFRMTKNRKRNRKVINRVLINPNLIKTLILEKSNKWIYSLTAKLRSKKKDFKTYPILFIRTPKCGSSSVVGALRYSSKLIYLKDYKSDIGNQMTNENLKRKVIVINSYSIKDFAHRFPEIWSRSYKWTIVRNPYKRTVSAWKFLENLRDRSLLEVLKDPPTSVPGKYNRDFVHFTSSLTSLLTINNQICVDHIIKFEDMENGVAALSKQLGMELPPLPKLNVTLGKSKKNNLDADSRQLIQNLFMDDFQNFDYQL